MSNRIFYLLSFLFFASLATAQNYTDALRYSLLDFGGTARAVGSGSALGALGADFSVMNTNPAGLAWYRNSEFIFTPGVTATSTDSRFLNAVQGNNVQEDSLTVFNLSSLGTVVASRPRSRSWRTFNFAIGFNRVADFNRQFFFQGASRGSIVNRFQEIANSQVGLSDFESELAFNAEAIYDFDEDGFYNSDVELNPDAIINRRQRVTREGSISELGLSLSANYNERLMIGATVGVPFVNFTENKIYNESDDFESGDAVPFFDDLEYREELTTTGIGVNLKLGIILRPHQALRLGLAVHTPTAYRLEDNFSSSLTYNYTDDGQAFTGRDSLDGLFEYRLSTPWRFIGSAGVIVGKYGFLSGEVELVDYADNSFDFDSFVTEERVANDSISTVLNSAMNIRLGGEIAYEVFRFRGGLGFHQSPFAGDDSFRQSFSLGLGMREQSFFFDLAYRWQTVMDLYIPYLTSQSPEQIVENDTTISQFLLTVGFRF